MPNLDLDNNFSNSLACLGDGIATSFGGTSGPLYGVLLSAGSHHLLPTLADNSPYNFL